MKWIEVDQYHAENGTWTMVIHGKKELGNLKFGLFENGVFRGVRDSQKEAVALHKQLAEGKEK
jgi:hypothetical protein